MTNKTEKTLLITREDVARLLTLPELIESLREAHKLRATVEVPVHSQRAVVRHGESSTTIVFPGVLPNCDRYTVKVNAKTDGNVARGLPFLRGVILLINRQNGANEVMLEAGLITAMRAGSAAAVAADALARRDARSILVIGAGLQAEWTVQALTHVRKVREVHVYDVMPERADDWKHRMSSKVPALYHLAPSVDVAREVDIVVTATQSHEPILNESHFRPGQCILAIGADEPGKNELSIELLRKCLLVPDEAKHCLSDGAFNAAHARNEISETDMHAELGEILAGKKPGRTSEEQSFVFGNVGLPFQDLVAAQIVQRRALAEGVGMLFSW